MQKALLKRLLFYVWYLSLRWGKQIGQGNLGFDALLIKQGDQPLFIGKVEIKTRLRIYRRPCEC